MFVDKNVPFKQLPIRYVYIVLSVHVRMHVCVCVSQTVFVRAMITVHCFRLVAFGRCYRAEAGKCQYL